MQSVLKTGVSLLLTILPYSACVVAAEPGKTSGSAADNAYAAKLWSYMRDNKLVGAGRQRSFPFEGSRPHGSIQEIIATDATIDGQQGRLLVKHNYAGEGDLTPGTVYAAEAAQDYVALTVMFQREAGYDATNGNWFWAEYNPDGSVLNYQGTDLSGRVPMCLGCHIPLGGNDREVLNGTSR